MVTVTSVGVSARLTVSLSPQIRVSESYTRLFRHSSDEETDSEVEEVVEKKFGTEAKNLRDALKTNFAVRKAALGIPRMEGHMRVSHEYVTFG